MRGTLEEEDFLGVQNFQDATGGISEGVIVNLKSVKIGDKIGQGVFMKYLTVDDEEEIEGERKGGLGSTGK